MSVVRLVAVFGGGTQSTGEAWYDTIDLVRVKPGADSVPNFAPNPALHHGVDGKPYGWFSKQISGANAEPIWATGVGVARVGAFCLSIKSEKPTETVWFSDIRVIPGKNYKFSSWIKSANVSGGSGAYFTVANIAGVKSGVISGSGDYQQVHATFNSGKLECIRLLAWLGAGTSGQAWYDDIEILEA